MADTLLYFKKKIITLKNVFLSTCIIDQIFQFCQYS